MTYYEILGVSKDADGNEIRSAYRKLAFECHPDRNPGDSEAEEKFKKISEAYAVLMDETKRAQYDRAQMFGGFAGGGKGGFSYTQEEIFRDLFQNQDASRIFRELFKEFEKAGLRTDPKFFQEMFFRGAPILLGGAIVFGSLAAVWRELFLNAMTPARSGARGASKTGIVVRMGKRALKYLVKRAVNSGREITLEAPDVTYNLSLSQDEAVSGKVVEMALDHTSKKEVLKINIPPGVHQNTRLRIRGKGREAPTGRGDLYLVVSIV